MCGLVDFAALHTSITRLAGLSIAGMATYAVSKMLSLRRRKDARNRKRAHKAPVEVPQKITLADSR